MFLLTLLRFATGMIRRGGLRLVPALFVASSAFAASYYVSPLGNDSNSGTSTSRPWKTITKVNSRSYAAGDRIYFQGGQTFSGNLVFTTTTTGTNANRVTVSSYGSGKATINAGTGAGLTATNIAGLTISNLVFSGGWDATTQTGNTGYGISFATTKTDGVKLAGVTIQNCEVKGFKLGGIVLGSGSANNSLTGYTNVLISGCTVHDNGHVGITTYGPMGTAGETAYAHTSLTISSTQVYRNKGVAGSSNHSGSGILLGQVSGATVQNCVAYENGLLNDYPYAGPAGIWAWDSTAVVFQYNESHHNSTGAGSVDGDGFDFDGGVTNSVMQYNYSHDNNGAGFMLYEFGAPRGTNQNNTVRYNVTQNDSVGLATMGGIYIGGYVLDGLVYNNTAYNTTRPPLRIEGGDNNWIINNIFFSNGAGNYAAYLGSTACWLFNNAYWSGAYPLQIYFAYATPSPVLTSLAQLQATGNEMLSGVPYGFNVDPLLVSAGGGGTVGTGTPSTMTAYQLQTGSPLRNVGFDLRPWGLTIGATDFYLLAIPPLHVGAY